MKKEKKNNLLHFSSIGLNQLPPTKIHQIQLRHQGFHIGDFKPLHASVDAKLQAICQSMAEMQKQGGKEKPKRKKAAAVEEKVECKVETASSVVTESEASGGSSPLSDLTFPDVEEAPLDVDSGNFELLKYPSYEIDWASILSSD